MPHLEDPSLYARASETVIFDTTRSIVAKEVERSNIFDATLEESIPKFALDELSLGRVLGRGGFCVAREINSIKLRLGEDDSNRKVGGRRLLRKGSKSMAKSEGESTREYLARRLWAKTGTYVIKQVDSELFYSDRVTFLKGMIDLALETKYLASLDHPHVLKIRGISNTSPFDLGYFVVLDQLQETLGKRLNSWMQRKRATKGITGALTGGKGKVNKLFTERLLAVYDIAEAMDYLHGKRIIYRDLKPDNIGFDSQGNLKIFDFGLAKELLDEERTEEGLYHMTSFTGAIRYMAPEIGLRKPYGLKADVYSWSMIMWYTMALEPPMGMYTPNMFVDRVFQRGSRPILKDKWAEGLKELMKKCWSPDINKRPDFESIMVALQREVDLVDPEIASFMGDSNHKYRERP